ncbi:SH2 domain containing protein [Trichomonas vaginalis G3]|uniref:SH2 domain containing protein n=1 Tax=Trichomonas vaginalis (strain ATCC PRA-98 / G3) TaxID=412133 RepID=A2EUK7_TRIV3|nr:transcription elongation factor SPT6 family [Trichomonas vaginalis G3]EAY03656.1 SH2 domain containing protein [Trichomonas vaginalis G3]KAI5520288.1 transcription elongation factor SPT6 family [Trichomonas vaginalis G3]|eukprot:XP_001315879.1 SH2 domain containing protein [Trichomonas vaginalis G3]
MSEEEKNDQPAPPPAVESELSSESSSDYDEEPRINKKEAREDFRELISNRGPRLSRQIDSSDSSGDLESDDEELDTRAPKKERVKIRKDDFVVGDDGSEIYHKKTSYAVSANANLTLNSDQIKFANKLFAEPTEAPHVIKPKMPEIPDVAPVNLIPKNEFERECDRIPHDVDESKIADEARWIMDQHFKTRGGGERDIEALVEVLKELHNEKHTPQFIINYRKNIYRDTVIGDEDIYHIQNAIREFKIFSEKRIRIQPLIEHLGLTSDPSDDDQKTAMLRHFIRNADDTSLDDLYNFDELQMNPETTPKNTTFKRNAEYFQAYIDKFIYSPMDFVHILSLNSSLNDPPEPQTDPQQALQSWHDELSTNYPSVFPNIEVMTRQMVGFAAKQLATHPLFIDMLRTRFSPHIVINTQPTTSGAKSSMMYPKGKYGSIKRLKNKPIISFNKTDKWLLIVEAFQSGNLTYTIDTDKGIDKEIEEISTKYRMRYPSDWDSLRKDILQMAIKDFIWPQIVKETEDELKKNAEKFVCNEIETRLFSHLTSPPYTQLSTSQPYILKSQKILAMHYTSDDTKRKIYAAMVNEKGNIIDSLYLHSKIIDSKVIVNWDDPDKQIKEGSANNLAANDLEVIKSKVALVKFIETHHPPVIAITASCLKSASLVHAIVELVHSRIQPESNRPRVLLAPVEHAILYAHSRDCCKAELHELPKDKRADGAEFLIAASTARRMQNPMAELCRLITPKKNHLTDWAMTPFQSVFSGNNDNTSPVAQAIERACLRAIALTGVDMTAAISNPNLRSTVQFIPGLGPHTAEKIIDIAQKDNIKQRSKLRSALHEFDDMVVKNALPFIRFPMENKLNDDHSLEDNNYLDGTLIPMDEYNTAMDILKRGFFESQYIETNIIELFSRTSKDTDITEPVKRYVAVSHSNNEPLIEFIAQQLRLGPYETLRYPAVDWDAPKPNPKSPLEKYQSDRLAVHDDENNYYRCMSDHEVFEALTSASTETIQENVITAIRIVKIDTNRMQVIVGEHSSGIRAFCTQDVANNVQYLRKTLDTNIDSFDGRDTSSERELINTTHDAVITRVDESMVSIDVCYITDIIEKAKDYHRLITDEDSFDFAGEDEARAEALSAEKNMIVTYQPRSINHKNFKQVTMAQAEAELSNQSVGSFIFRPSSKGNEHISLTILFPNNICANYDIVEQNKQSVDAVGKDLFIRDQKFSDLEEIKWKFIYPIKTQLENIMKHEKWVEDPSQANEIITEEKAKNENMLVYRITTSIQNKGYLELVWEGTKDHRVVEPIRLFGDKIFYRQQQYNDIRSLILFFKKIGYKKEPEARPRLIAHQPTDTEKMLARRTNASNNSKVNLYGRH